METKTQSSPKHPKVLNEEAMKGVWVDGVGIQIGPDYVILEGVITQPRTEEPYVASRILFPRRILEQLVGFINETLKKQKEAEESKIEKR